MSAPDFVTIYTEMDSGYYQVVASDMDVLEEALEDYETTGQGRLLRLTQISGAPLMLRASKIEAIVFSTEYYRDNMYRLEQMTKEEKRDRGDFDE